MFYLRRDKAWYKYYKRRNKMGRKERISLCERGMEIACLSFQIGMVLY